VALAREGVAVTIVARKRDALERTAGEIRTLGATVTPVVADITTPEGRKAALEACPEPDILVNNADGRLPGDFRQWTREDWISAIDTICCATSDVP
jgi:3-oxoacyl-[acyl-carrier protein] reductase